MEPLSCPGEISAQGSEELRRAKSICVSITSAFCCLMAGSVIHAEQMRYDKSTRQGKTGFQNAHRYDDRIQV